jgi:hypothetical protein
MEAIAEIRGDIHSIKTDVAAIKKTNDDLAGTVWGDDTPENPGLKGHFIALSTLHNTVKWWGTLLIPIMVIAAFSGLGILINMNYALAAHTKQLQQQSATLETVVKNLDSNGHKDDRSIDLLLEHMRQRVHGGDREVSETLRAIQTDSNRQAPTP